MPIHVDNILRFVSVVPMDCQGATGQVELNLSDGLFQSIIGSSYVAWVRHHCLLKRL
ncbi:hypothetical protein [Bradyrhizobium canariense]|uniref:hypothetical protein n=1 Tax=Bradyrhizobium canariense TaxID=255045 RepID=UPI00130248CC|nr:hypothetical protein [Bradyrhizobium canariense]